MTVEIKIDFNTLQALERLKGVAPEKWSGILKSAATETAFYVRNKVRQDMPRYIDRPKPFTVNSIFVKKESGPNGDASVQWRQPVNGVSGGRYLRPTVFGGQRNQKSFERKLSDLKLLGANSKAIPTDAVRKDGFGNVPQSITRRVLDAITFNPFGSNYGGASRRRASKAVTGIQVSKTKLDVTTFFAVPSGAGKSKLSPGIYERRATGFGSAIRKLFTFTETVTYKKTFPFYALGEKAARERFPAKLDEAIKKSLEGKQVTTSQ